MSKLRLRIIFYLLITIPIHEAVEKTTQIPNVGNATAFVDTSDKVQGNVTYKAD